MTEFSFLELAGLCSALLLALIFVWAAAAKLGDRSATETDFRSLGLPQPGLLAKTIPVIEIGVAGLLAVSPGWGGVAAFGLLTLFTAVLVPVVRSGRVASCACFGGGTSKPVGARHIVRNGVLAVLALAATAVNQSTLDLIS